MIIGQVMVCSAIAPFVDLCRYSLQRGVMRDTLSNMVSCFLMSRQQAHMTASNSQFLHIYIC